MSRLLPRTLFAQMLLILLAGLAVSHLVGTLIYASDRAQAVRAIGAYAATQRIANLTQLIDEAPPDWRSRIVRAASDPSLRVTLSAQPPVFADPGGDANSRTVRHYLADQLPPALAKRLRVAVTAAPAGFTGFAPHATMSMAGMMRGMSMTGPMTMAAPPWLQGAGGLRSLRAAVQLTDGDWLTFAAALPNAAPPTPWPFVAATATMAVIVVLASAWAVGRVTAPLRMLAQAAERLGRDVNAPPIAEAGTREVRQATQSFNQMQARVRRLVDNRTRMLAALSHDLRTPLTLLRLRTEGLSETEDRDRMLATIGELDAMIGASLSFARDQAMAEAKRRTDLGALLTSIVDDMADAGLPVTMGPVELGGAGLSARCAAAGTDQPDRQCGEVRRFGARGDRRNRINRDDQYRRQRRRHSRGGAATCVRAISPAGGIAQPGNWRHRPRLVDRAVDRAGAWR